MMRRKSTGCQSKKDCTKPGHFRGNKTTKDRKEREEDENIGKESPASRGYPKSCTDFGEFSMQMDNRAVRLRTAHLHWLIDNKVYTNNNMDDFQFNLRQHTPSNSARYPIRIPHTKNATDPEWVCSDYRVHIYHSKKDESWVKHWLVGILEAKRFRVTTNCEKSWDCDRVIVVLSPHLLREANLMSKAHDGMRGRISMVIKKEECLEPKDLMSRCQLLLDLSDLDINDYTFQAKLMSWIFKGISLPESVCSA